MSTLRGGLLAMLIVVVAVVLNGCSFAPPTETVMPTDTEVVPTATPEPILGWPGIVPGESTEEDVRLILGPPDGESFKWLPGAGPATESFPTWYYDSLEEKPPGVCVTACRGGAEIYFMDGVVVAIEIVLYEGEPTLAELLSILGESELIAETTLPPVHWFTEEQLLEEMGIDWWKMTVVWGYAYPNRGVLAHIGPQEDHELGIFVYYPRGSLPPEDMPVRVVYLFPSMSLEEYCASSFLYDWMREFYP